MKCTGCTPQLTTHPFCINGLNIRGRSLVTERGGGGATKWENRGSET